MSCIAIAAYAGLCLTSCKDDDTKADVEKGGETKIPTCISVTPSNGSVIEACENQEISVKYNMPITLDKGINVTIDNGKMIDISASDSTVTIIANLSAGDTKYTINIPSGLVVSSNGKAAESLTITYTTDNSETIDSQLVFATSESAQKVYSYLLKSYGNKTISGMMANVSWNNKESERIYKLTGKYPAINGYDYIHLPYSVANQGWIDYNDITPVKDWTDQGGLAAFSWHWLVPTIEVDVFGEGTLTSHSAEKPSNAVATLWEGEESMGEWASNVQIEASKLAEEAGLVEGAKIHVSTKDFKNAQGSFKTMADGWPAVADGYEYFNISGSFALELTNDIIENIKQNGLVVSGQNYTATGVYIIPAPEGGEDTELSGKDNKSETFPTTMPTNWSGWYKIEASAFSEATIGDVITAKVTDIVASDAQGSFKNGASWAGLLDDDGTSYDYFVINGDFSITLDATLLAAIQKSGLIISGHDYTLTGVVLTHYANGAIIEESTGIPALSQIDFSDYTYQPNGKFHMADAVVEGTWENDFIKYDLENITKYLLLLKEANIPIIWRPLHEASGGWFWWGTDAESYKKLWILTFEHFKKAGLDNMIWVWTSQVGDDNWYPGDDYVDIIGCDIYGSTPKPHDAYSKLKAAHPNKIITLSECGWSDYTKACVPKISQQISNGAKWSWFMPWYDNDGAANSHADDAWWQDAMDCENVITRDQLPSFK